MTYTRYVPSPPLDSYIEDLYYLDGPAPYPRQKEMPVASINVMVNLGYPFQVYKPDQQVSVLQDIFGFARAAEHAVGQGEQHRPLLLVMLRNRSCW